MWKVFIVFLSANKLITIAEEKQRYLQLFIAWNDYLVPN